MGRILAFAYGIVAYVVFFVTFLYAIGFVGNIVVPKSIDSGPPAATDLRAFIADIILLSIFALQHSIMARPAFKRAWTKIIPKAIERSTYVLLSSFALILMYWQWRPLTGSVWSVTNTTVSYIIWAIFFLGWGIVLISTFLISHFDLFGLRQVWLYLKNKEYTEPGFTVNFLYNFVRHPIMLGFIIAFWATPHMTVGHLLFSVMTTVYILVAIQIEERDIARVHGQPYNEYRRRVSMIVPMPKRPAEPESPKAASV